MNFSKQCICFCLMIIYLCVPAVSTAGQGNDSYTVLLISSDNADGGTVFTDTSAGGDIHTITPVGTAHHDTRRARFNGSSIELDGNNDTLSMNNSADFEFGTDDFTIDFWVNFKTVKKNNYMMENGFFSSGVYTSGYQFIYGKAHDGSGENQLFLLANGDRTSYIFENTLNILSKHTWHHIALVRKGDALHCFVDGVLKDTKSAAGLDMNAPENFLIGQSHAYTGAERDLDAYIDEFRISKGIARWTENFIPGSIPYSKADDPPVICFSVSEPIVGPGETASLLWEGGQADSLSIDNGVGSVTTSGSVEINPLENTVYTLTAVNVYGTSTKEVAVTVSHGNDDAAFLLISSDAVDGSTVFTDTSYGGETHIITPVGSTRHDTRRAKFNNSSIELDGNNDSLSISQSPDFELGNDDFTVDFWVNFKTIKKNSYMMENGFFSSGVYTSGYQFIYGKAYDGSGENQLFLLANGDRTSYIFENTLNILSEHTWHHIALVRKGDDLHCFVDGVLRDTKPASGLQMNAPGDFLIGQSHSYTGSKRDLNAYIDEFRMSGTARWTGNFTPGTTPYGRTEAPPVICFSASDTIIEAGGATTLSWAVSNADTISIDNGIGTVSGSGALSVTPPATAAYTLTAGNAFGTSTRTVTVDISYGNDDATVLLIQSDNEDGETVFTDTSSGGTTHEIVPGGSTHHETGQAKFNGSAIELDGNTDNLSIAQSPDFEFGNDDFTIDFWVNFKTIKKSSYMMENGFFSSGVYTTGYQFMYGKAHDGSGENQLFLLANSDRTSYIFENTHNILSEGTWYHIALVRKGDALHCFVNGILKDTKSAADLYMNTSGKFLIGQTSGYTGSKRDLNAYIDEFRVSRGVARWTGNFTPRTASYGTGAVVAYSQALSIADSTAVGITLAGSGSAGNGLTYHIASHPSRGTLSGTPPDVTYSPIPAYTGEDSFTFYADNGVAVSDPATVSIGIYPAGDCSSDTYAPVITLAGDPVVNLSYGETYTDPGALAFDACDGELTETMTVDNRVDVNRAGKYVVTYDVTDNSGNAAQTAQRTVVVEGVVNYGNMTIYEYDESGRPVQIIREVN
ncbi:MAG: DUF5011 domain-containing protein [Desulfobacterales bacterium]|nr:DUF5011 domain-containing protein [Desulfobacterales bacterium]